MGHKLAARAIAQGETILKYNCPIGVATQPIPAGAFVHTHNVDEQLPADLHAPEVRTMLQGYLRADGRKGIRNILVVAYLVECAHHVAREIAASFRDRGVHLIGFPGCYPNAYALAMMEKLCTHPNVGGALLVSLGCEGFNKRQLAESVDGVGTAGADARHPGHRRHAQDDRRRPRVDRADAAAACRATFRSRCVLDELVVGTICGGSDATSGLTANPAMGVAFDLLVADGAAAIFEETGELIGMEHLMAARAASAALGDELKRTVAKAARLLRDAGLRQLRAGQCRRRTHDHRGEVARRLRQVRAVAHRRHHQAGHRAAAQADSTCSTSCPTARCASAFPTSTTTPRSPNSSPAASHLILFSTGRGSVVGSAIAPVIKVCANPETWQRMQDDMDVDAGRILDGRRDAARGRAARSSTWSPASPAARATKSEALGHQEFILTYKSFEPLGPACLPAG